MIDFQKRKRAFCFIFALRTIVGTQTYNCIVHDYEYALRKSQNSTRFDWARVKSWEFLNKHKIRIKKFYIREKNRKNQTRSFTFAGMGICRIAQPLFGMVAKTRNERLSNNNRNNNMRIYSYIECAAADKSSSLLRPPATRRSAANLFFAGIWSGKVYYIYLAMPGCTIVEHGTFSFFIVGSFGNIWSQNWDGGNARFVWHFHDKYAMTSSLCVEESN